jgi:hypothetical protein
MTLPVKDPVSIEEKIRALVERARRNAALPVPPPEAPQPPKPHSEPPDREEETTP